MTQGAHNATKTPDNPFWNYSINIYRQEGCAEFLLKAQGTHGLDINVLLFIGWLAAEKRVWVTTSDYNEHIFAFQLHTVQRIRNLRIRTKAFNNHEFYGDALYQQMKELELAAESIEQDRLFRLKAFMPQSKLENAECITQSLIHYLKQADMDIGFTMEGGWLQTLIQYLQPTTPAI